MLLNNRYINSFKKILYAFKVEELAEKVGLSVDYIQQLKMYVNREADNYKPKQRIYKIDSIMNSILKLESGQRLLINNIKKYNEEKALRARISKRYKGQYSLRNNKNNELVIIKK